MKHGEVFRVRARLAPRLPNAAEIVRGAFLQRTIQHRQGCAKCRRGGGRTVWVLTVSHPGGQTRQFRIRPEPSAPVQKWLENYQRHDAPRDGIKRGMGAKPGRGEIYLLTR